MNLLKHSADGDAARIRQLVQQDFAEAPLEADPVTTVLRDYFKAQELSNKRLLVSTGFALLLAAIGVYGLAAQTARVRLRELAIRRVFGATGWQLFALLLKPAMVLMVFAITFGSLFGWLLGEKWLASYAEKVNPQFMPVLLAIGVVVVTIGLSYASQAWKAAKVNSTELLRES